MSLGLVVKNTTIYALGIIGMRMAAFLLIPLYTHSLSIDDYGFWAVIQLTMQLMIIFMGSGMQIGLVRFTKEFKEKNQYGELLGTSSLIIFVMGLIVTMASFTFFLSFFRKIFHLDAAQPYITMVCFATLMQSLVIHLMTHYRAEEKVLKFMIIGVSSSLILILSNWFFVCWLKLGVMGALWAFGITYLIFLIYLPWDIFPGLRIGISRHLITKLLQFGFPLIFADLALLVLGGASVYVLSYFISLEVVAVYSLGAKLASILQIVIILPFQLAFGPFIFLNMDKTETKETISKLFTYLTLVLAVAFFGILFGSRLLLPLIAPPEYSWAFLVILLLLPGTAFIGIYFIGETLLLGAVKKTHIIGFVMTVFAIISIGLNYLLIPMMQWYGAVIATNFSFVLSGLVFLALGKKYFPFSIEWKRVSVAGGIMMFFFLLFFVLDKVPLLTFTLISLLAGLGSIVILCRLQFFSSGERTLLKELLQRKTTYEI